MSLKFLVLNVFCKKNCTFKNTKLLEFETNQNFNLLHKMLHVFSNAYLVTFDFKLVRIFIF